MAVHLPLAVILLWPVIDLAGLLFKRADVSKVALALLIFGLLVSLFATATGQAAFDAAVAKGADPELLSTHADNANLIPWLLLLCAAVRFGAGHKLKVKGQILGIVAGMLLWPLAIGVGNSGGKLVYEHGIGRRDVAPDRGESAAGDARRRFE